MWYPLCQGILLFYLFNFFFLNKLSFIYGLPQPANLTLERVIAVLGGEKEGEKTTILQWSKWYSRIIAIIVLLVEENLAEIRQTNWSLVRITSVGIDSRCWEEPEGTNRNICLPPTPLNSNQSRLTSWNTAFTVLFTSGYAFHAQIKVSSPVSLLIGGNVSSSACPSPSLPAACPALPTPASVLPTAAGICLWSVFVDGFTKGAARGKIRRDRERRFARTAPWRSLLLPSLPCRPPEPGRGAGCGSTVRARPGEVWWEATLWEGSRGPRPSPQGTDAWCD